MMLGFDQRIAERQRNEWSAILEKREEAIRTATKEYEVEYSCCGWLDKKIVKAPNATEARRIGSRYGTVRKVRWIRPARKEA